MASVCENTWLDRCKRENMPNHSVLLVETQSKLLYFILLNALKWSFLISPSARDRVHVVAMASLILFTYTVVFIVQIGLFFSSQNSLKL